MEFRCVAVYRSGANREKEDRQLGKRHNLRWRLRVRPGWCFRFWSAEQKAITGAAPDCSWLAGSLLSSKGSGQRPTTRHSRQASRGPVHCVIERTAPLLSVISAPSNTSTLAATFESTPDLSEGAHVAN